MSAFQVLIFPIQCKKTRIEKSRNTTDNLCQIIRNIFNLYFASVLLSFTSSFFFTLCWISIKKVYEVVKKRIVEEFKVLIADDVVSLYMDKCTKED